MATPVKTDISLAGNLFDDSIEDSLDHLRSSLDMMSYLFMSDEYEGSESATSGIHTQLRTLQNSLTYCLSQLTQQRKTEHANNQLLNLLLDCYCNDRKLKLNDLSECDAWCRGEISEDMSVNSIKFIEETKTYIREAWQREYNNAISKLEAHMDKNGMLGAIDERAKAQVVNQCKTMNDVYKMCDEHNEKQESAPS